MKQRRVDRGEEEKKDKRGGSEQKRRGRGRGGEIHSGFDEPSVRSPALSNASEMETSLSYFEIFTNQ